MLRLVAGASPMRTIVSPTRMPGALRRARGCIDTTTKPCGDGSTLTPMPV